MAYTEKQRIKNLIGTNEEMFENWKDMVVTDKIACLEMILTAGWDELHWEFGHSHEVIEKIMGRPVWTHEMAFPEMLYKELENGKTGEAFSKSLSKIAETKPVIIVESD